MVLHLDARDRAHPVFYVALAHHCSWDCAKAHTLDDKHYASSARCEALNLLRKKATGTPFSQGIRGAPSWKSLKLFGGPLSIEAFRAGAQACTCPLPESLISTQQQEQQQQQQQPFRPCCPVLL